MNKLYPFIALFYLMSASFAIAKQSPHKGMKMPCQECHTSVNWKIIEFDHKKIGYRLTGKHESVSCQDCHSIVDFRNTPRQCAGCHLDVHQGRLGKSCGQCHTTNDFSHPNAESAHANTSFPLLGRHANLDCYACHYSTVEGEFLPLQSECFSCHEPQYRGASSLDHLANGFSKRCEDCHGFYSWQPAEFAQHDRVFPIFNGEHAGEWNTCRDCHFSSGDFSQFSCLNCHEHNKNEMDHEHREVAAYMYESHACLSCHPTGSKR